VVTALECSAPVRQMVMGNGLLDLAVLAFEGVCRMADHGVGYQRRCGLFD
jgi:hypothetical protein